MVKTFFTLSEFQHFLKIIYFLGFLSKHIIPANGIQPAISITQINMYVAHRFKDLKQLWRKKIVT